MENYFSKILVAAPELDDPDYERSVVMIFLQSAEEITGVMLNKPFYMSLESAYEGVEGLIYPKEWRSFPLFDGGPVATANLFAFHSSDVMTSGSQIIRPGLAWADCDSALLEEIVRRNGPKDVFFASGLANWKSEDFISEMGRRYWGVLPYDPALLQDKDPETMWERCKTKVERALGPGRPFRIEPTITIDETHSSHMFH